VSICGIDEAEEFQYGTKVAAKASGLAAADC
jgi:hypothetical protein